MSILSQHLQTTFDGKKILILGWGREGQSSYALLRAACPTATITVSDQNQETLNAWQKQNSPLQIAPYLQDLRQYDVIFKTPGIPTLLPELQDYIHSGGVVTIQLNEFLKVYRDQTIGVTGTKGKSTTSSLIAMLAAASGKHTLLAGNIGLPVFEIAEQVRPETQIVIEMSSYQLDSVSVSPHTAVFLNFFPEHLNYHQSIGNYLAAKAKITQFQFATDTFIYNQDVPEIEQVARTSAAEVVPFSYTSELHYPETVHRSISELETVNLPQTVKKWNVLPALLAAEQFKLSVEQTVSALQAFKPLPHRLETISTAHGITWIDDTLATIPEATIAALHALPKVDVILLGGFDRGISYQKIVDEVMTKKVPAIAFFRPSGQIMYDLLTQKYPQENWPKMLLVETMEEAVRFALENAPKNAQEQGVVLLSPASPSFGQFKDYEDKSAQFRNWIDQLTSTS